MVSGEFYVYWDSYGVRHVLEPGERMPRSVLDIVGGYRTLDEAEAAAACREAMAQVPAQTLAQREMLSAAAER